MTFINLGSRTIIKKYLKNLFVYVENGYYEEALACSMKLQDELVRYRISRSKPWGHFQGLFNDLNYTIQYATNNHFKKEILIERLSLLSIEIMNVSDDPLDKLKELYDEIRYNLGSKLKEESISNIIDACDEIRSLEKEFEEKGGTSYNFFPAMVQHLSNVEPVLMQVSKTSKPSYVLLDKLFNVFSGLFMSIQRVLTPPIRIDITKQQLLDNLESGATLKDVSEGTAIPEEKLRRMLQEAIKEKEGENL